MQQVVVLDTLVQVLIMETVVVAVVDVLLQALVMENLQIMVGDHNLQLLLVDLLVQVVMELQFHLIIFQMHGLVLHHLEGFSHHLILRLIVEVLLGQGATVGVIGLE
jgi:hypothetical protein